MVTVGGGQSQQQPTTLNLTTCGHATVQLLAIRTQEAARWPQLIQSQKKRRFKRPWPGVINRDVIPL